MGNIELNQGVFIPVFPFKGFSRFRAGFPQKHVFIGHVLEYHDTVILGMGIGFHAVYF